MSMSPMKGQFPDPEKIRCRDCLFRDMAQVKLKSGKTIPVGVTRFQCDKYKPPIYNGKPHDVLFQNADCKFYVEDGS